MSYKEVSTVNITVSAKSGQEVSVTVMANAAKKMLYLLLSVPDEDTKDVIIATDPIPVGNFIDIGKGSISSPGGQMIYSFLNSTETLRNLVYFTSSNQTLSIKVNVGNSQLINAALTGDKDNNYFGMFEYLANEVEAYMLAEGESWVV